jgi:hypothetical protein
VAEQAQAWRVATMSHDPGDLWRVRPQELATKAEAWESGTQGSTLGLVLAMAVARSQPAAAPCPS